jgi:hypothetical protein
MLICQGPVRGELALSKLQVNSLTVCSVQLQTDQTIPLDVCRKLQLHAPQIDVLKMGREGHLQKATTLDAHCLGSGLYANLIFQSAFFTERNPSSPGHTSTQKQKHQRICEQALP